MLCVSQLDQSGDLMRKYLPFAMRHVATFGYSDIQRILRSIRYSQANNLELENLDSITVKILDRFEILMREGTDGEILQGIEQVM